jgi:hypothetical protein
LNVLQMLLYSRFGLRWPEQIENDHEAKNQEQTKKQYWGHSFVPRTQSR